MRGVRRGRLCGRGDRGHRHAPVRFLAHRFSTIEFRVTDVCLSVDEAVMVAGLFRGLARACSAEALAGTPLPRPRPELLRAATWRAARYGVEADLVDVLQGRARPAPEQVEALLRFLRPTLDDAAEWDEVSELVHATLGQGTGSSRQRKAHHRAGSFDDVMDLVVAETLR